MTGLTSQPYTGDADLQRMIELIRLIGTVEQDIEHPDVPDLREHLQGSSIDLMQDVCLWSDHNGVLQAFALLLLKYDTLMFHVHPAMQEEGTSEILRWALERGNAVAHAADAIVQVQVRDTNVDRIGLLKQHGFELADWYVVDMIRHLDEPIPEPQLPKGFRIRHVEGEHEVEAYVAMHQNAFGTTNMTMVERLATMRDPDYDPELDLVVVSPEGILAAFCVCSVDREELARSGRLIGHTDPVGTRADFQRRGLGHAVMLAGLRQLRERGLDFATLTTGGWNKPMQQLAEAVGYHVDYKIVSFIRTLTPHTARSEAVKTV